MNAKKSTGKFSQVSVAAAVVAALFAINLIIHIGFSPAFNPLTTDSGVFAYCGARMLAGDVLYRDCWDNKPPAVYLIDAGVVALGGQNPWAIWWFQLLWTTASSAAICFVVWRAWRNGWAAAFSTLLFIGTALTNFYYTSGNLTENYLLLPLALTAGALLAGLRSGRSRWMAVIGALTAFAVLLKPTYFGMGAAAALTVGVFYFIQRRWVQGLKQLGVFMLGLILPLALVGLIFWRLGALSDLWFAVFQHNVGYVEAGLSRTTLRATLQQFFVTQPLAGLFWIALASLAIYALVRALSKPVRSLAAPENYPVWWLGSLLLALPFQMVSIGISGKNFGHYFLEIMPALALLASAGVAVLSSKSFLQSLHNGRLRTALQAGLALALLALAALWLKGLNARELINLDRLSSTVQNPDLWDYPFNDLEQYIVDNSQADESVLIWATHPDFNFVTGRRSPTRYIFPLHVLTPTPKGESGFPELLAELAADPPRLIIQQVVSSANLPSFSAPESELCSNCSAAARSGLLDLQRYIEENYSYATQIYDWQVFVRK